MSGFDEVSDPARARNIIQVTGVERDEFDVFHDCARLARDASGGEAAAAVVAGLNNAAIAQSPYYSVHSGVAGLEDRIVALPAASGRGKTTLTAALTRQGFDFLSDEALVFTDDGTVLPYPKPFAFSPWSAAVVGVEVGEGETLATAGDLGVEVAKGGRLTDLIVSEYGQEELTLVSLPKSQAVAALIEYSFNHYKDPERAFRIATDVARDLNVWRLEYDDPIEAAELIARTLR